MRNWISGYFLKVRRRVGLKLNIRQEVQNWFWWKVVIFISFEVFSWHSGQVLDWHSIGVSSILCCGNFHFFRKSKIHTVWVILYVLYLSLAQSNDVVQPTTLVQKCAIPVDKFGFKKPIWKLNFYLLNKNFLFDVTSLPHQMTIYDCKKVPVFSSLARVLYRRFFFRIPLVKFDTFDPAKGTHWFSVFYYMIIKTNLP